MDTVDDMTELESLPVEQLVELIREKTGAGVTLSFPGKVLARQLGRRVRPRTMRTVGCDSLVRPRCDGLIWPRVRYAGVLTV